MKKLLKKWILLQFLFVLLPVALFAQDIGKSWEFNTDDDFEGITLNSSWISTEVKDGYLTGTIATKNPSLSSDTFKLAAADYGFVQIRLKMKGATQGDFLWNNDAGQWGMSSFSLLPDTTFQVINIPVFLNAQWTGNITRISKLSFNPEVGSRVVIDYIHIYHGGYWPDIIKFIPLRTVFKVHATIPLFAVITNPGDTEGHLYSRLNLPEKATLLSGSLENDNGSMFETTDTIDWSVRFDSAGVYDIKLLVFTDKDTIEKVISLNVTDQYWKQDDFLLSAWSPPYGFYGPPYLDTVFEYYKNANFNNMLWVRDDDSLMAKVHQFGFKYLLYITNIVGSNNVRAPDHVVPPDIPEEKLQNLDNLVTKYKEDPNLIGYFICDEPFEEAFKNIGTVVERIRKNDPERLEFVNLLPDQSQEGYVEKFLQTTGIQLLSYDKYVFLNDHDSKHYFRNLEMFRKYALMYDLPFCNIIQAIGTNGTSQSSILNWRTPTEAEHRWLVYSSLTYGVHALIWFHWHLDWGLTGNPDRDTIYPSIQKVNAEIDSLSAIMLQLKTTGVYHTVPNEKEDEKPLPPDGLIQSVSIDSGFVAAYYSGLVAGYFQDEEENDYFMLMNENYNDSVDVTVHLNGIANELRYFDVDENQWKDVSTSDTAGHTVFNIYLRPGGGKLFSVTLSPTGIPLHKTRNEGGVILKQNYPNPFHGNTTIDYTVKPSDNGGFMPQRVNLRVFDQYGREVAVLVRQYQYPGSYKVVFHAESLAPGIYYYRLATDKQVKVRKMLLLR